MTQASGDSLKSRTKLESAINTLCNYSPNFHASNMGKKSLLMIKANEITCIWYANMHVSCYYDFLFFKKCAYASNIGHSLSRSKNCPSSCNIHYYEGRLIKL